MPPPKTKRPKRKDSPEPDDDDDDSDRMPYFVPEEGIDIEPLALYARGLLDNKAKVKIGNHPQVQGLQSRKTGSMLTSLSSDLIRKDSG